MGQRPETRLKNNQEVQEGAGKNAGLGIGDKEKEIVLTRVEEGDDLRNEEGENPSDQEDTTPRSPAFDSVAAHVLGAAVNSEENESRSHGSVEASQEDDGRNHERESSLLVNRLERAKSGSSDILITSVGVDDGANNAEDDDLANGAGPESLGEVAGIFHLGDE